MKRKRFAEDGHPGYHALPAPDDAHVVEAAGRIAERVRGLLERRGLGPEADPDEADSLAARSAVAGVAHQRLGGGPDRHWPACWPTGPDCGESHRASLFRSPHRTPLAVRVSTRSFEALDTSKHRPTGAWSGSCVKARSPPLVSCSTAVRYAWFPHPGARVPDGEL